MTVSAINTNAYMAGIEDKFGIERLLAHMIGYTETEVLDCSSSDPVPATIKNCRAISVDQDGFVKIDYPNVNGDATTTEVKYMFAGAFYNIRNVSKAYRLSVQTAAKAAKSDESLVNGVKLHR